MKEAYQKTVTLLKLKSAKLLKPKKQYTKQDN
jgi:hypothetical protein